MNDTTLEMAFADRGCFPHQAQFAASFFAANSPQKHLLVSAPGMGKGFASALIVNHALASNQARRVLVLAPSALVAQWQEMLLRSQTDVPVMVIDRRRLRELEGSQPVGAEMWPTSIVVVASLDFAKQSDIAAILARCNWDLLVVDEVQLASPQTQRAKVLLGLMDHSHRMRVLLLQVGGLWTEGEMGAEAEIYRDARVTVWNRDSIRDRDGMPLLPEIQMTWITYRRHPEEAELHARLQQALRALNTTNPQIRLVAATLLHSASSSPFALEQRLRRIQQRRNELAHGVAGDVELGDEADELGLAESVLDDTDDIVQSYIALAKIAESLCGLLEELPSDSKFDALVRQLNSVGAFGASDRRICVFTKFVDTATYLQSALRDHFPHVRTLGGGHSFNEREQCIADFAHAGGILILTEAIDVPMPEVAAVVFYDLPLNPAVFEQRIGRFVRIGRQGPIQIVAFTDESNSLVIERLQRKIVDIKETLGESEIEKALFSFEAK